MPEEKKRVMPECGEIMDFLEDEDKAFDEYTKLAKQFEKGSTWNRIYEKLAHDEFEHATTFRLWFENKKCAVSGGEKAKELELKTRDKYPRFPNQ